MKIKFLNIKGKYQKAKEKLDFLNIKTNCLMKKH